VNFLTKDVAGQRSWPVVPSLPK